MTEPQTTSRDTEVRIKLHPKQGKAYRSDKRIVLCSSGIQGGKSFVGAWKLRRAIEKVWPADKYPNVNFAVTAPDHKSMVQSTRVAFDRVFKGLGKWKEFEQTYRLNDRRNIFFRTMIKNINAVEGIPDCVFIWSDECGQYPRGAFINLESRTAFKQGQWFGTTTPYAYTWPKKEVIDKFKRGEPDIDYFEWLSIENPAFPREEYERQKRLLSKREFERKYMGIHTRMEGLIFEDWGDDNLIEGKNIDLSRAEIYGGIDWGFDHPFALSIRAFMENGDCYGISFTKVSGLSVSQSLEAVRSKTKTFGVKCWYAGADRPDMILELNNCKIPCMKYHEGRDEYREVDAGNQKLAEIIKTRQYRVFREAAGMDDLVDEYETYHWDTPEGEDDKAGRIKPLAINDDLISAERYVTVGTIHLLARPKEKIILPIDYLRKRDLWKPTRKSRTWDAV